MNTRNRLSPATAHMAALVNGSENAARFVRSLAASGGDPDSGVMFAMEREWVQKAGGAATTGSISGAALAEFFDTTQFGRASTVPGRLPLVEIPARVPMLRNATESTASWVGEGDPIPVGGGTLERVPGLVLRKVASIATFTRELLFARDLNVDAVVSGSLERAVAKTFDRAFLDPNNAGDTNTPASITRGIAASPLNASSGATFITGITGLIDAVSSRDFAKSFFVMHPAVAMRLSPYAAPGALGPAGGSMYGLPVITSPGCVNSASGNAPIYVLLDAGSIAIAWGDTSLAVSDIATITHAGNRPVSMYQTETVAVRAVMPADWKLMLAGGVQWGPVT